MSFLQTVATNDPVNLSSNFDRSSFSLLNWHCSSISIISLSWSSCWPAGTFIPKHFDIQKRKKGPAMFNQLSYKFSYRLYWTRYAKQHVTSALHYASKQYINVKHAIIGKLDFLTRRLSQENALDACSLETNWSFPQRAPPLWFAIAGNSRCNY